MPELHPAFLIPPIAHRGFHSDSIPENSRAAFSAAIEKGYGVEIDLQLSKDNEIMAFHDYDMGRLTGVSGPIQQKTAKDMADIFLANGEPIPTLVEILKLISGQVAVLVEIKDQDGGLGPNIGRLEQRLAEILADYHGPIAIMSFNPYSILKMAELAPDIPRGLTASLFPAEHWPLLSDTRRKELIDLPDYDRCDASFVSYHHTELDSAPVKRIRDQGDPVFCWTIRSETDEHIARRMADNITFEGYTA